MSVTTTLKESDAARALYHRVNWRLLPFLLACCMFAYLDRVNVGFAKFQMRWSNEPGP